MLRIFVIFVVFVAIGSGTAVSEPSKIEPITYYPGVTFNFDDGIYTAIDGDSFWLGIHPIRLYGVDTVETDQACTDGQEVVDCHRLTMNYLENEIVKSGLICKPLLGRGGVPKMSYNRYVTTCTVDGKDVGRKMVQDGWAVAANGGEGHIYRELEMAASTLQKGLHRFQFEHPYQFRKQDRTATCSP